MAHRGSKSNTKLIDARERVAMALELRKVGYTFEEIAQRCGYSSAQVCYNQIAKAIARITNEPAEELLKLELARLDALFIKSFEKATTKADYYATMSCLTIMERRAKLLGLDAAVKTDLAISTQIDEARIRLQAKLDAIIKGESVPVAGGADTEAEEAANPGGEG